MNRKTIVLIIEDDDPIENFLETAMHTQGYKTLSARNGEMGISLATSWNPDIILLDLGLPDLDGIEVIHRIRVFCASPVIVVSARHQDHEKVEALDAGADDYISKPFSVPELLARMRVALRHTEQSQADQETSGIYQNRGLQIDFTGRIVKIREETIHLTPIEYDILCLLAVHAGRVLTHRFILQRIRGQYQPASDAQALRVFVSNLRRKIEVNPADPVYLQTEVGVGYRLSTE
jgi:two-component system KDP operon response regulator KdpE